MPGEPTFQTKEEEIVYLRDLAQRRRVRYEQVWKQLLEQMKENRELIVKIEKLEEMRTALTILARLVADVNKEEKP